MYLVTGGAGFIGSVVAAAIEQKMGRPCVVVADWMGCTDKWRNLSKRNLLDLVDPGNVMSFLTRHGAEVQAVIHIGANADTTEKDVDHLMDNNVRYSLRLYEWCATNGKPFIFASSAATYGDRESDFTDSENLPDLMALEPLNPYGYSKVLVDRYLAQATVRPPQWASLRFFNVYGPNEYHKGRMASVVLHAYKQIIDGGKVRLFKSHRKDYEHGEQLRDFIYVKDVANTILWLLANPQASGIFNLGTGEARSFRDLATAVFKAMGKRPDIEFIDMPEDIRSRYQYFTQADMGKLNTLMAQGNTRATHYTLETGVEDYVKNHLMQHNPYL